MEAGDGRVEKEAGNDERRRGGARQPDERGHDPEQLRDDADMQSGDGEKMERAGLLERLLDVVRRFVPQAERHPVDERDHFRRILQFPAQGGAHPFPRPCRAPCQRIATAALKNCSVLWIAGKDTGAHIAPREISPHVKDPWIPCWRNRLGHPVQADLVA